MQKKIIRFESLNLEKFIDYTLALIINLIIFSTNNILMKYAKIFVLLFIIVFFMGKICLNKKLILRFNKIGILYILLSFVICSSFFYGISTEFVSDYIYYFVLGIFLVCFKQNITFYKAFYNLLKIFLVIFTLSIYVELLFPFIFNSIFLKFSLADLTASNVITSRTGTYSGLAFEKAYAAFLMNIGIGLILSVLVYDKKITITRLFSLSMLLGGIMLTGKRTLFLIPIVMILLCILLFTKNNRILKFIVTIIGLILVITLLYLLVPNVSLVLDRLFNNSTGDVLTGRTTFWNYALQMFNESPILGKGFGSYNLYVYEQGFRYYGRMWNYFGHNIYYQMLGETGIIGFTIFMLLSLSIIRRVIFFSKKTSSYSSLFSLYLLMLFFIYGITGNTLYYQCQFVTFLMAVSIVINLSRLHKYNI